jgi:hypothetical protein
MLINHGDFLSGNAVVMHEIFAHGLGHGDVSGAAVDRVAEIFGTGAGNPILELVDVGDDGNMPGRVEGGEERAVGEGVRVNQVVGAGGKERAEFGCFLAHGGGKEAVEPAACAGAKQGRSP